MSRHFVCGALFGLGLVASAMPAQDLPAQRAAASPAPGNRQRQMQHLDRLLELTAQQAATLAPVMAQRQRQRVALRSDTSRDRRARRAWLRAVQRESDAQIQAVLSDSQRQKYLQWKQHLEERCRQKRQAAAGTDNGGEHSRLQASLMLHGLIASRSAHGPHRRRRQHQHGPGDARTAFPGTG